MKKLKILGTGCAKCNALAEAVKKAADELGIEHEVEKITDLKQILSFGVMAMPALVVDGAVKAAGKIPNPEDLKALILADTRARS